MAAVVRFIFILCVSCYFVLVCSSMEELLGSAVSLVQVNRRGVLKAMSEQSSNVKSFNGSARTSGVVAALDGAPVLSHIHVSCYVTAANRASPVFEVAPQSNCVRVVNKPTSDSSSGTPVGDVKNTRMMSTVSSSGDIAGAEWNFHTVFSSTSPSHSIDFFTEITLPALRSARDGINSNVVVWGVHPTQKFRLLFGKSVGAGGFAPQPEMEVNDVVELYGQLVGILHAFFSQLDMGSRLLQRQDAEPWRLGISSWIIVNNQAIDLLKTPTTGTSINYGRMSSLAGQVEPMSFVSLEAPSLATAFRIVQTAKTNRIVHKQNEESVHFFVRLALFHDGQISTVHLVDLVDQKDFKDQVLIQEKLEFYNILQGLRQRAPSPRQNSSRTSVPDPMSSGGKMVLSNFMLPLLTANAKTFLYANVIDSRASLRESVQMLNAVANLRGFACVCKPLRDISFDQLGFQTTNKHERQELPNQLAKQASKPEYCSDSGIVEAQPTLSCLAPSPPLGFPLPDAASLNSLHTIEKQFSFEKPVETSSSGGVVESEAMSWLNMFAQRKRDILGGSTDTVAAMQSALNISERPAVDAASPNRVENGQSYTPPETLPSVSDLYEQLRESLENVNEIELGRSESPQVSFTSPHSLPPDHSGPESHAPHPIVDQNSDGERIAQVGYCRSTVGGSIPRHQQQSQYSNEDLFSWSPSTSAEVSRPIECFTSRHHRDSNAYAPDLRPEIDSMVPADISALPLSSAPPVSVSVPRTSSLVSKPDIFALEALKKAGIAPCVMKAPNVEGLDVKTTEKVQAADATLLRKNYDALLSIVREQQQTKEATEVRAAEALQDQEEQRAMFEVQIENMKLTNIGLRSKLRALEKRTSLPQVFEQYEQELRTLHAQVQELQSRNVTLELRVVSSSDRGGVVGGTNGASIEFKKKYQQVVEEKLALEREMMEFRKRERHYQVHSRLAGESTRRVDQLSRDLNNKEEDLVATRLSKQRLSAEMNQALEKADQLHHENEKLQQEKAATTEELLATRMYLASLENEKKKASILDRFVEKHGDRMNKLRQRGQSSSSSKGESWHRDQYARECEDKLLAAIKRSLPQAVPLCNKLLRRLEMQELSLREFSEREVDFINLLVELVSDQPTVSLKQMIEQEMKKL